MCVYMYGALSNIGIKGPVSTYPMWKGVIRSHSKLLITDNLVRSSRMLTQLGSLTAWQALSIALPGAMK